MPTLNEIKYSALLVETGADQPITLNELECLKLNQLGYSGTLQDMYHQFFTDQGVPSGTIDQRWMAYLNSIGYTSGTIDERMHKYYSFISSQVTHNGEQVTYNGVPVTYTE